MQITSLHKIRLPKVLIFLLFWGLSFTAQAQLLEGRGKLKTADKEKKTSSKYDANKNIKKRKEGSTAYPKKKVRYSEKSEYKAAQPKVSSGSNGFKNAPRPKVKYGKVEQDKKPIRIAPKYSIQGDNTKRISINPRFSKPLINTKREQVNPKYSLPFNNTRRTEVNPKYSTPNNNEKRIEVNPRYSIRGKIKRTEVNPRYSVRNKEKRIEVNPRYSVRNKEKRIEVNPRYSIQDKEKRIEVNPRYSVRDKERRIEVNPRYSQDIGFKTFKKVVPRSITGKIKDDKYDISPRYSIYEPFDQKKLPPLSISSEGMMFDNTKERRKNAIRNSPEIAEFSGFKSDFVAPDRKKNSTVQANFSGFNVYSPSKIKSYKKSVAKSYKEYNGPYLMEIKKNSERADINDFLGAYKFKPIKRKSNMHPSAAYLGSEDSSHRKIKAIKRDFNIVWVRLNGNKNIPENVKKLEKKKSKRDKKEGEIWVY